jgi:hypothetical protein
MFLRESTPAYFFPSSVTKKKSFETLLVPDWRVSTKLQNQNIMSEKTLETTRRRNHLRGT